MTGVWLLMAQKHVVKVQTWGDPNTQFTDTTPQMAFRLYLYPKLNVKWMGKV